MTQDQKTEWRKLIANTPSLNALTDGLHDAQLAVALADALPKIPKPETRLGERGVYAVLGPAAAEAFLQGLEAAAGTNPMIARVVRWLRDDVGIDIGNPMTQANLLSLAQAGVVSVDSANALIAFGSQSPLVTKEDASELR